MDDKFDNMLEANRITHKILEGAKNVILNSESITPFEVNQYAMFMCNRYSVIPAFLNYKGFPAAMCISVNDAICHGVPTEDFRIVTGDLVSLDFGVIVNGYCSDAAISFVNTGNGIVSKVKDLKKLPDINTKEKLVNITKEALDKAVENIQNKYPNCRISDISDVIQEYDDRVAIVEGYGGHGIGKDVHEERLFIPNYIDDKFKNKLLKPGDFFTIEPMFAIGNGIIATKKDEKDEITVKTIDGSPSAHFEYSIAITKDGVIVLK